MLWSEGAVFENLLGYILVICVQICFYFSYVIVDLNLLKLCDGNDQGLHYEHQQAIPLDLLLLYIFRFSALEHPQKP